MCLGAAYWSRIGRVVFASDRHEAAEAGFRDSELYRSICAEPGEGAIPMEKLIVPERGQEFTDWHNSRIEIDY
jgi:guanine deaminase